MSEVQSRPPGHRGRGSYRGGRGGFRGGRGGSKSHKSDDQENIPPPAEEHGEIGELKKQFGNDLSTLRELFPEWSDEDLVYALKETDGDLESCIDRMSSGSISQWQENKKKQAKSKEPHATTNETTSAGRGGRGRGTFETRGRSRAADRGRGVRGGRVGAQTNGTRAADKSAKQVNEGSGETSATTTETTGTSENTSGLNWDTTTNGDTGTTSDWANETSAQANTVAPTSEPKNTGIPAGKVLGWNKLFEKPKPAPVPKTAPPATQAALPEDTAPDPVQEQTPESTTSNQTQEEVDEAPELPPSDPPIILTPSRDELTEKNLEKLPDTSHPPTSGTAISTAASTPDPQSLAPSVAPALRPGISGYVATALKATGGGSTSRSLSHSRKIMEQQEAVIMPGNHAVDRAAVQFGSMGLNGSNDALDVDEEREDPETRTQLPDDSPVAPRASLPPPPPQAQTSNESTQATRQAPGLPSVPQQPSTSPGETTTYPDQYARFGQPSQKAYDPFGQQPVQQTQPPTQTQEPFNNQAPSQPQQISSSAPTDYSSFYNTNQQRDAAYQNYYGSYGQGQDPQQRSGSAFGTSAQETPSQYATSRPQPGYGQHEAQNSGSNTPNPTVPGPQAQQSQQSQHMHQAQGSHGGYSYGYHNAYNQQQYPQYGGSYMNQMAGQQPRYGQHRPMFDDVRRQNDDYYMTQNNQYGYGHNQQYGSAPYNKSSMYGQPQHQYSYEHSASPANAGGFGQTSTAVRENVYGRTGSAQPSEAQQSAGNAGFGNMNDPFGRTQSGFGSQGQPLTQQHSAQGAGGDSSKDFDPAKAAGPSPSISQANRPGSANNVAGQQQPGGQSTAFPAAQSQQAGQNAFGSYPQWTALGSFGGHHQGQSSHHQNAAYGSYGGGAGFGSYGGYGSGRGWNGNYGGSH